MLKKAEKIKPSQTQQIQKKTCQARNKEKKQARRNERLLKIKIEKSYSRVPFLSIKAACLLA